MKLTRYLPIYIVALFFITLVLRVVLIGYYNNNLGGIELNVVYGIQRLLLHQPLYQNPTMGSFAGIQYTPLWYSLIAGLARPSGITGHDVQSIFVLCRIVALLFGLLTVGVCAAIVRHMGFRRFQCIVFALPVIMVLTSHYYTRGDSMHLFFFAAALWAYLRYSNKRNIVSILIAALCSACCVMTKQSGILSIGIIGCCLLLVERSFFKALLYADCTLICAATIALLCIHGSTLHLFYMNAWLGLKNGYDASFLRSMFFSQYFLDLVPCYFLGALMVWVAVKKITDKTYRILCVGLVLSFLFAVVTGLKKGSSNNYFTEYLFFVLLALPHLLRAVAKQASLRAFGLSVPVYRFAMAAFLLLITSKTIGLFSEVCIEKGFKNNKEEYTRDQALYQYFQQNLKIRPGDKVFFTERRFLDNIFINYAIMPTKDVSSMVYMADPTTYDYSLFTTGMNSGLVTYIVTGEHRDNINVCNDSLPFILFDTRMFRPVATVSGYCIYRYVPALPARI